jgi:hypothetical protein
MRYTCSVIAESMFTTLRVQVVLVIVLRVEGPVVYVALSALSLSLTSIVSKMMFGATMYLSLVLILFLASPYI